ncbi:MAG: RDD family protein [Mycobacteriales bacterium]
MTAVNDPATVRSAGFGRRLGALAIDCAACAGVAALFTRPDPPGLLSAAVFFVAYTGFVGIFAETLGMRLLGLRCIRFSGGGRLGLFRAALRTMLLQLVVPALLINPEGRGLHDRAADSVVVRSFKG